MVTFTDRFGTFSSGLVVSVSDCGAKVPMFEHALQTVSVFFTQKNHCDTQLWARAAHLLCAQVDSAFYPPWDDKWNQPYGSVNVSNNTIGDG